MSTTQMIAVPPQPTLSAAAVKIRFDATTPSDAPQLIIPATVPPRPHLLNREDIYEVVNSEVLPVIKSIIAKAIMMNT